MEHRGRWGELSGIQGTESLLNAVCADGWVFRRIFYGFFVAFLGRQFGICPQMGGLCEWRVLPQNVTLSCNSLKSMKRTTHHH